MALRLDKENALIAGVCAGIAKEVKTEPIVIRLAFIIAFLLFGIGPVLYLIMWLFLELTNRR